MNIYEDVNDEFSQYFRGLGYVVSWDFNKQGRWYEILDPITSKMLCQVDLGTPLVYFLEDLEQFVQGKEGTSPSDYVCAFASDDAMNAIYHKIKRQAS